MVCAANRLHRGEVAGLLEMPHHADSRDYYVSLRRGARYALLAGPFATHTEALAWVKPAAAEAETQDPRACWDASGTCSLPRAVGNVPGKLNERLGVVPRTWTCPALPY